MEPVRRELILLDSIFTIEKYAFCSIWYILLIVTVYLKFASFTYEKLKVKC